MKISIETSEIPQKKVIEVNIPYFSFSSAHAAKIGKNGMCIQVTHHEILNPAIVQTYPSFAVDFGMVECSEEKFNELLETTKKRLGL